VKVSIQTTMGEAFWPASEKGTRINFLEGWRPSGGKEKE
jgi:hypothetical protein